MIPPSSNPLRAARAAREERSKGLSKSRLTASKDHATAPRERPVPLKLRLLPDSSPRIVPGVGSW